MCCRMLGRVLGRVLGRKKAMHGLSPLLNFDQVAWPAHGGRLAHESWNIVQQRVDVDRRAIKRFTYLIPKSSGGHHRRH